MRVVLAGLGLASLTVEAADAVADRLAATVGIDVGAMREALRDVIAGIRHDAAELSARRGDLAERAVARAGLVRREEIDDLALRLAQIEHRLRLLEQTHDATG